MHRDIRSWIAALGVKDRARILYGGSVRPSNIRDLLAQDELDGVLVGGASLDPKEWSSITTVEVAAR